MQKDITEGLNDEQKKSVLNTEGPLMIVAGAGSGKTRVITLRIAQLLQQHIPPQKILALTFSNKAANEMRERIEPYCKGLAHAPMISTFHSFGYYLVSKFHSKINLSKKITVYDTRDQIELIKELLSTSNYPALANKKGEISPYYMQQQLSLLKNDLLPKDKINDDMLRLRKNYDLALLAYHALDFDELILKPIELLKMESLRDILHAQFEYFLVDEFQDTSKLQFEILKRLVPSSHNICVVGDDDQSIYSWRGADLENWSRFMESFPSYKEVVLDTSYRCSPTILQAANGVIANSKRMRDKILISQYHVEHHDGQEPISPTVDTKTVKTTSQSPNSTLPSALQNSPIHIVALDNEQLEAEYVTDMAAVYHYEHHIPWSEIGILSRTNNLFNPIEVALKQLQIPYTVSGGSSFFDHIEIKNLVSYLQLANNQNDDVSFRRVINTPKRGIGVAGLTALSDYKDSHGGSLFDACIMAGQGSIPQITNVAQRNCYDFAQMILAANTHLEKGLPLSTCLADIVEHTNYNQYIAVNYQKQPNLIEWKQENVLRLKEIITRFDLKKQSANDILNALSYRMYQEISKEDDALSLMTIHAAKGLEKTVIFILGAEHGILPHSRSLEENPEHIHEETRLCYVAITRAKSILHFSWCKVRKNKSTQLTTQQIPSSFLGMIPKDIIKNESPETINKNKDQALDALKDYLDAINS